MRHLSSFALVVLASLSSAPASACSDAGPPNRCNEGGAAWIACDVHADCPTGQSCHPNGYCICGECEYGETCDAQGCRCAYQTRPTPPAGCEAVQDSCSTWHVICPGDAGPGPMCSTDGATPYPCTTAADCVDAPFAGPGPLVCTSSGYCDCPSGSGGSGVGGSSGSAGCSAEPGGAAPGSLALLLALLGAAWLRRR